ncbi:AAA family ATPase [Paenibacillus sp. FSL K6-2524]|uniref:AAA family ATPase n=1 Tax=Paenibacillus sp. FSL K6-2524 TaxID=2954516 RepID=UPI004046E6C7
MKLKRSPRLGFFCVEGRKCNAKIIIILANQKGGVGKTTTAMSLKVGLVKEDQRVILVNL